MMKDPRDVELEALFRALREEDARKAPSFEESMIRARRAADRAAPGRGADRWASPRVRRGVLWGGGLLAAAALAGLLLLPGPGSSDAAFEHAVRSYMSNPAGGAWRSPTDALLDLPGSRVLSTRPRVGSSRWPGTAPGGTRMNSP